MDQTELIAEVMQAERAWVEAHRRLDVATLDRLMAEDYFIIHSDGSVAGNEEDLATYRSGRLRWLRHQITLSEY